MWCGAPPVANSSLNFTLTKPLNQYTLILPLFVNSRQNFLFKNDKLPEGPTLIVTSFEYNQLNKIKENAPFNLSCLLIAIKIQNDFLVMLLSVHLPIDRDLKLIQPPILPVHVARV